MGGQITRTPKYCSRGPTDWLSRLSFEFPVEYLRMPLASLRISFEHLTNLLRASVGLPRGSLGSSFSFPVEFLQAPSDFGRASLSSPFKLPFGRQRRNESPKEHLVKTSGGQQRQTSVRSQGYLNHKETQWKPQGTSGHQRKPQGATGAILNACSRSALVTSKAIPGATQQKNDVSLRRSKE